LFTTTQTHHNESKNFHYPSTISAFENAAFQILCRFQVLFSFTRHASLPRCVLEAERSNLFSLLYFQGFNCFHSSSSVSLRPQKTQQVRHIQEQANAGARAPRQPFRGGARGRGQLRGRSLQTTADVTTPPKNTSELNQVILRMDTLHHSHEF
jgi:hypothetical protein